MHVAEVDGERGKLVADGDALLRPRGQPVHGEAVPVIPISE